jgi:3-dehydroquinate synthase
LKRIKITLEQKKLEYDVLIEPGLIHRVGAMLRGAGLTRTAVVSSDRVFPLHGQSLLHSLEKAGMEAHVALIPDGERFKTLETLKSILERMAAFGCDRHSLLITLGGGVTGDVGGFAAAAYMRGISYVHVPTTLLAQVDSSIGGKVGVDLPGGKNMAGAFHHPRGVFADPEVLRTLPAREFANGLAEVVKAGVIASPGILSLLEEAPPGPGFPGGEMLAGLIEMAVRVKADIVVKDPLEGGERMKLNLGHTLGHALECALDYTGISHGEGVALGMLAACRISVKMGALKEESLPSRLEKLLGRLGLPVRLPRLCRQKLAAAISLDKKKRGDRMLFVLPVRAGEVTVRDDVDGDRVWEVVEEMTEA